MNSPGYNELVKNGKNVKVKKTRIRGLYSYSKLERIKLLNNWMDIICEGKIYARIIRTNYTVR